MKTIISKAFLNAALVSLYIVLVATFMNSVPAYVETLPKVLGTVLFLSLFVFSAAITSSLVFGRPVVWYLDGKKREAVILLIYTLAIFFCFTLFGAFLVVNFLI